MAERARPPLGPVPVEAIRAARERLDGIVTRTPLVRLAADAPSEIWLKLENLQPIGSFKLRGAANALALADPEALSLGCYTASAGNMAQGVAWSARERGIGCDVIVPEHAPRTKLDAIERLGARVIREPFDAWWRVLEEHAYPGLRGTFVHPVADPAVIAGNGTIGLELLEDLPDVDTIVVPFGGGGLVSGIASAVRATRPEVRVVAAEVETAAPLAASLRAGAPQRLRDHRTSFVDGIGGMAVLPEMWPLLRALVDDAVVVGLAEVAAAIRVLLERNRVLAEGAGAAAVAAALGGRAGGRKVACIVSGGNLDLCRLATILAGDVPA
jgi:threonine dehydratase